jgi:hypothetical protein
MMRLKKHQSRQWMTRNKAPEWSKAAGLSSWGRWIAGANGYVTIPKSVFAAPRPVEASVLSNRIGLESQEWRWERRVEIRCKVCGCPLAGVWRRKHHWRPLLRVSGTPASAMGAEEAERR